MVQPSYQYIPGSNAMPLVHTYIRNWRVVYIYLFTTAIQPHLLPLLDMGGVPVTQDADFKQNSFDQPPVPWLCAL